MAPLTESQALRLSLRAQQRAANTADTAARREERGKARERAAATREKFEAETRARRARFEGQTAAMRERITAIRAALIEVRKMARQRERSIDEKRETLLAFIREHLEGKIDRKFLTAIARLKSQKQLDGAIEQVKAAALKAEHREVADRLRKRIESMDPAEMLPAYRDAVKSLVDSVSLTGMTGATERRLRGLAEFLERTPGHRVRSALTEELGRLDRTALRDMPIEDMIALDAALEQIIDEGREAQRQRRLREDLFDRQARRAVRRELEASANIRPRPLTRTGRVRPTRDVTPITLAIGLDENLTIEDLARILGGAGEHGHTVKHLYRDVADAQREVYRARHAAADHLAEALRAAGLPPGSAAAANLSEALASPLRNLGDKIMRAIDPRNLIGRAAEESGARVRTVTLASGAQATFTPAQRMHLAALMEDPSTHDLIRFDGVPIHFQGHPRGEILALSEGDIDAILDTMSEPERALVRAMVDYVNSPAVRGMLTEWSVRHLGHDITQGRRWFSRHRMVDPNRGEAVEATLGNLDAALITSAGLSADAAISTDGVSLIKARGNDTTSPIIVGDLFVEFTAIVEKTAAVAHLGPALRQAMRILNDPDVMAALGDSNRGRATARIQGAYQALLREFIGHKPDYSAINRLGRKVIDNATVAVLGLNPIVALYQPASLWSAASEIEMTYLRRAIMENAAFDRGIGQRYLTDPYLRHRIEGSATGFVIEGGGADMESARGPLGRRATMQDAALFMTRAMDNAVIKVIWRAAEIKVNAGRRRAGLDPLEVGSEELNEAAGAIARVVVQRTQATFDALHTSALAVEAKTAIGAKLFTPFRSQSSKNVSLTMRQYIEAGRSGNSTAIRQFAVRFAQVYVMQSVTMAALRTAWSLVVDPPEDIGEALARFVRYTGTYMLSNPLGGTAIAQIVNAVLAPDEPQFRYEINPATAAVMDVMDRATAMTRHLANGDTDKLLDDVERIGQELATIGGVPILWPWRTIRQLVRAYGDDGSVIR